MHTFAVPLTSLNKLGKNARSKPFSWAKPTYFDSSSSNFNVQGHIWALLGMLLDEKESCLAKYINPVDHGEQVHTGMFPLVQE